MTNEPTHRIEPKSRFQLATAKVCDPWNGIAEGDCAGRMVDDFAIANLVGSAAVKSECATARDCCKQSIPLLTDDFAQSCCLLCHLFSMKNEGKRYQGNRYCAFPADLFRAIADLCFSTQTCSHGIGIFSSSLYTACGTYLYPYGRS